MEADGDLESELVSDEMVTRDTDASKNLLFSWIVTATMHPIGTVPMDKIYPIGTPNLYCIAKINDRVWHPLPFRNNCHGHIGPYYILIPFVILSI